jgi:hypothetical protein
LLGPNVRRVVRLSDRRYRVTFDGDDATRGRVLEACLKIGPVGQYSPAYPALESAYLDVMRAAAA